MTNERIGLRDRGKASDRSIKKIAGKVRYIDKASKFLVAGLAKNKTDKEINRFTEKLFQEIPPDKRKSPI